MQELINLRKYNGAIRPIGPYKTWDDDNAASNMPTYIHSTKDGKTYIITYNTATGYVIYREKGGSDANLYSVGTAKTIRFTSLHNVLIVINETDELIYYALYDMEDTDYDWIGEERFPETLKISFGAGGSISYPEGQDFWSPSGDTDTDESNMIAYCLAQQAKINNDGGLVGSVSFIYAWEMFDGTIVKHSPPFYLKTGTWEYKLDATPSILIRVGLDTTTYQIWNSSGEISAIQATYGKIIKGLNIYMTRPYNPWDADSGSITSSWAEMPIKTDDKILNDVISIGDYRLVKRISIDDLDTSAHELNFGDLTDIESRQALPVDNFTFHSLYAANDRIYNSRMWLGNLKTTLFEGFSLEHFIVTDVNTGTPYTVYVEVDIKTIDGIKTLTTEFETDSYNSTPKQAFGIREFFTYPDSRAVAIRLFAYYGPNLCLIDTLNLTPHPAHNFSYFIKDGSVYSETNWQVHYSSFADATSDKIIDLNRIQASQVDNPFYFPARNSYQAGGKTVVALGANVLPVETGQFGQYPLYAFCSDGIWALNFSSDPDILIDSIVPVNRDVCNNKNSIVATPYGIIYASDQGLMIVNGNEVVRLSKDLEETYVSALNGVSEYTAFKTASGLTSYFSYFTFANFLTSMKICYNYVYDELILTNSSYTFCYIYSFNSRTWSKKAVKFYCFIENYPGMLAERDGVIYDVTDEDFTVSSNYVKTAIETRPIKLSQDGFVKLVNLAIRCQLAPKTATNAVLQVFASIDGEHWYQALDESKTGTYVNDLVSGRVPFSAIQFVVLFSGEIDKNSFLTHLDMNFKPRFSGRMR